MKMNMIIVMVCVIISIMLMTMTTVRGETCPYHAAGCNRNKVLQSKLLLEAVFDELSNEKEIDLLEFLQKLSDITVDFMKQQRGCLNMLGLPTVGQKDSPNGFMPNKETPSFINTTKEVHHDFNTYQCLETNTTSMAYKNDPCCSFEKKSHQCCKKRKVTFTNTRIDTFNPTVETCCKNPKKIKMALKQLEKTLYTTVRLAGDIQYTPIYQTSTTALKKVSTCISEAEGAFSYCVKEADCIGTCNMDKSTCEKIDKTPEAFEKGMTKCLNEAMTEKEMDILKNGVLKKDKTKTIGEYLKVLFEGDICVQKYNIKEVLKPTNASECEAFELCNDGKDGKCTETSPFCGMDCRNETVAGEPTTRCFGKRLSTKSDCKEEGYCSKGFYSTKEKCETWSCTHPSYTTVNETVCNNLKICVGYPYKSPVCGVKLPAQQKCPVGFSRVVEMNNLCIHLMMNKETCESKNGTYILPPATKEECEQYGMCETYGTDNVRDYTKEMCEACTERKTYYKQSYNVKDAEYKKGVWKDNLHWVTDRGNYKAGKWMKGFKIDETYSGKLATLFSDIAGTINSLLYKPNFETLFSVVQTVACDCGTVTGENCFKIPPMPIGGLPCIKGVADEFKIDSTNVRMKLKEDSCDEQSSGSPISIYLHEILFGDELTKRSAKEEEGTITVDVKNDKSNAICSIVSDGYSITPAPTGGATLCLTPESKFKVSSSEFTKMSVVTGVEGAYTFHSDAIDEEGCFSVPNSNVYYRAMCDPEAVNKSSASMAKTSAMLIMVITLVACFI